MGPSVAAAMVDHVSIMAMFMDGPMVSSMAALMGPCPCMDESVVDHVPVMASSMNRLMASPMAAVMGPCMNESLGEEPPKM